MEEKEKLENKVKADDVRVDSAGNAAPAEKENTAELVEKLQARASELERHRHNRPSHRRNLRRVRLMR